ncbi:hypothetical protein Nepgr_014973 [Nepenthes gracilis]|uniref:Uncharacterized protein n=1 Tax=Nepenthes gracilis TaxID=150966 RepID=A0AAD3SL77_NEPGR|nr:hypothetical protein Nepgr_014973 [Nepenthes gracilis]
MEEFRPPGYQSHRGGRKVKFVENHAAGVGIDRVYVARSRSCIPPPLFRDPKTSPSLISSVKAWYNDPETKRKKRLAKYKIYSLERKVKSSFEKGCRWIQRKCRRIVHAY